MFRRVQFQRAAGVFFAATKIARLCLLAACAAASATLSAQQSGAASNGATEATNPVADEAFEKRFEARMERLQAAFEAFKGGDMDAGARAAKQAAVFTGDNSIPADVAEARCLIIVGSWLRNENQGRLAGQVGLLAAARLDDAKVKLTGRDKAQALQMQGEIYEHLATNRTKALEVTTQALALDPKNSLAREALERLEAQEAEEIRKSAENELARARAPKSQPKP